MSCLIWAFSERIEVPTHTLPKGVLLMTIVQMREELLKMKFEEVYGRFCAGEISTEEAASLLHFSSRTFLRKRRRYEEEDFNGQFDRRIGKESGRRASDDEVMDLCELYEAQFSEYNVRHFHSVVRRNYGCNRSYSWIKNMLFNQGLVKKSTRGGKNRKRRVRRPMAGMMIHQDGSKHLWIESLGYHIDLIVTMDDATSEITSAFFVPEEGTESSLRGIQETIEKHGLFCEFYTDRGSHYFYTPTAKGKVSKGQLTHVGTVLRKLCIRHIPSYSPQGRGRSERTFGTLQGRLPQELKRMGIRTIEEANKYLKEVYLPAHNAEFMVPPEVGKSAYMPWVGNLRDIMAYEVERVVQNDNTISYNGLKLQLCATEYRNHYVKTTVLVREYPDGLIDVWYGPYRIATYNRQGEYIPKALQELSGKAA